MVVADVQAVDRERCLILSSLASVQAPMHRSLFRDPFDLAIWHALSEEGRIHVAGTVRTDALPFDPMRRRSSVLVTWEEKTQLVVRGAYEEVVNQCTDIDEAEKAQLMEWGSKRGKEGKRILAVATRALPRYKTIRPELETKLTFVGLISFIDPLKKSAIKTIADARALGITVKILTGDGRDVAGAVAKSEIGRAHV